MKSFKELNIKQVDKGFIGDKIKIEKILNIETIIHAYKIEPSNFTDKGNGKRLCLQVTYKGELCILFTSAIGLQETIQQVPDHEFPIKATIIRENERFKFT